VNSERKKEKNISKEQGLLLKTSDYYQRHLIIIIIIIHTPQAIVEATVQDWVVYEQCTQVKQQLYFSCLHYIYHYNIHEHGEKTSWN